MTSIITMAAELLPRGFRSKKKSGTPRSAPQPKQMSCRFVRLNSTLLLIFDRSLGNGDIRHSDHLRSSALSGPVILKPGDGTENTFVVYPALELPGNGRCVGPVIDHDVGIIVHAAQYFHAVQILFMGGPMVGQHIDRGKSSVWLSLRQRCVKPQLFQDSSALRHRVPGKVYLFQPDAVDCGYVAGVEQAAVKALGKVHIGAAFRELVQPFIMVLAGQQIRIQQLDFPLTVPELRQVGSLDAFISLLSGNDAKGQFRGQPRVRKPYAVSGN